MEKTKAIEILMDMLEGDTYRGDEIIDTPEEDEALLYAINAVKAYGGENE